MSDRRTRRRLTYDERDTGVGGQELRARLTSGRRQRKGKIVASLSKKDLLTQVNFWKRLPATFTGQRGELQLARDAITTPALWTLPCYLVNLTALPGCFHPGVLVAKYNQSSGIIQWDTVNGLDASGANNTGFLNLYSNPDYPSNSQPVVHFGRANIKCMLYGQKKRPTRIKLSLVKFNDPDVAPYGDNLGGFLEQQWNTTPGTLTPHQAFWQARMRHALTHPAETGTAGTITWKGKMKTIKSETYLLEASNTTDADTNVHTKMITWSHAIDKNMNMRVAPTSIETNAQFTNAQYTNVDVSGSRGMSKDVKTTDRIFLLIEAEHYGGQTAVWPDLDYNASFDLNVVVSNQVTV